MVIKAGTAVLSCIFMYSNNILVKICYLEAQLGTHNAQVCLTGFLHRFVFMWSLLVRIRRKQRNAL